MCGVDSVVPRRPVEISWRQSCIDMACAACLFVTCLVWPAVVYQLPSYLENITIA